MNYLRCLQKIIMLLNENIIVASPLAPPKCVNGVLQFIFPFINELSLCSGNAAN